jgi:flotillin
MREIVGKMKLEEMVSDRQKFANLVKENADPDLGEMGLDIISFNVQNFVDDSGVIENLGVDNIVKIQKSAAIARAESEKEIAVAQAIAGKEANDAKVAAETAIAERNNELEIKKAELKIISDEKKADADAAYKIQEQERRKTIEATTGDADVVKQEKEVIVQQRKVELETQKLDAEIKKKAEAEKFKREQEAEAELFERKRKAEAEMFEREKDAEARKIQAEADLFAKEQEAKGIQAVGTAEAKAIEAKGIAEAEALEKKAEAMTKYGKAAMLEMIVTALPEMARAIAEPLATIDKVTIIDGGSGESGVTSMGNYVPSVLAKTMESVKEITGLDLVEVMRAETYDAKVNHNINVSGIETPENEVSSKEVSKAVKSAVKEAIADTKPTANA